MRKENYLVSCVLTDVSEVSDVLAVVQKLADEFAQAYAFWELVVPVDATAFDARELSVSLKSVPNTRLLVIKDKVSSYRARRLACAEAIGDIVVVCSAVNAAKLGLPALAHNAYSQNMIVHLTRTGGAGFAAPFAKLLSWVSGFDISTSSLRSLAFPRDRLDELLQSNSADLDIRFERRSALRPRVFQPVPKAITLAKPKRSLIQRLSVISDLLVLSTPRLLAVQAGLSACVAVMAVIYALYAVCVFFLLPDVAPGWLSTSLVISGISFFLGVTVASLSLGLVGVYDRLGGGADIAHMEEFSTTDFFSHKAAPNVETSQSGGDV